MVRNDKTLVNSIITIPRETHKKTTEGKLREEKKPLKRTGSNQINAFIIF